MNDNLCRSPLFERQRALGARFVPFAGWEMPVQFSGVTQEHQAVRNAAGLFDVSHMGELWIEGPDALAQANRLITNDLARRPIGGAVYTLCCDDQGRILDDLIVYRLADDRVLTVCNASNRDKISAHFAREVGGNARFIDRSDETALLALQGPRSADILAALLQQSALLDVPRFNTFDATFAGQPLLTARTGYSGEDGFELLVHHAVVGQLWDALLAAGREQGLVPIGLGARDTLRLEACLRLYGNDIDETTSPYEAGLGWTIKLDKDDFIGKGALLAQKNAGPQRKLVGFEMVGRGIARHGYRILAEDGTPLGVVTSGAPSLSLDKRVGLGYVPTSAARVGTPICIEIRSKMVAAKVCPMPFYRRNE